VPRSKDPPDYMRALSTGLPVAHQYVLPPGGVDALLSTSAPSTASGSRLEPKFTPEPAVSAESIQEELDYNVPVDEFELLKARREQERIEKQKATLARTISSAPTVDPTLDTNLLMENLQQLAKDEEKRKSTEIPPADTQL